MGCGRQGAYLAAALDRGGWTVAVVDRNPEALARLPGCLARSCFVGDALKGDTLEQAGITEAHALLAATAPDHRNCVIAALGRSLGLPHAIARVRDPSSVQLECLGIETVCPTTLEIRDLLLVIDGLRAETTKTLQILVAGCGHLGSNLASALAREGGHRVVVVDANGAALEGLRAETFSGALVEGDATEPSTLRGARIEDADLVVTATRDDDVNLMIAALAQRLFGVRDVLARVCDPEREAMVRDLGFTTVCPTRLGGEVILGLLGRDPGAHGPGARSA